MVFVDKRENFKFILIFIATQITLPIAKSLIEHPRNYIFIYLISKNLKSKMIIIDRVYYSTNVALDILDNN